ncbi:MAG TPA: hypothetical protein VE824_06030 [Gaiellales bacterium]|nr:hypothetical protein [Gaiellales bacterium]
MHATIRSYTDPNLADLLASNRDEVEEVIRGIPGVRSYTLMRTQDGCAAITVGDDEKATRATTDAAAEYLRRKSPSTPPPALLNGDVIVQLGAGITV